MGELGRIVPQGQGKDSKNLVWRNRKKISQIIKDYFYLPFFLLIILWPIPTIVNSGTTLWTFSPNLEPVERIHLCKELCLVYFIA